MLLLVSIAGAYLKQKKDINKAVTTLEGLFKFCGFGFDYNGNFIISECLKSYGTIDELLEDKSVIEKRIIEDFKPCNVCGDCDKLNSQLLWLGSPRL